MLCANLVCMWLMFNTLKVAQAEKQIYPERFGKLSNFHTSPGAGTGEVAGPRARRGGAVIIKNAVRVNAAATTQRNRIVSPPINQPRNSPTTGFPHAYVCTPAAGL